MILTDFGPNEDFVDAFLSLKLLFSPWRWQKGNEILQAKEELLNILNLDKEKFYLYFFLTGRAGLYNLLKTLKLKAGDEILIQAFTCSAVVLPIKALNLKPVYVDVEDKTFSINPIDLEKKISTKTKVVILQHTFGITPRKRKTILDIIKQHDLVLIEDIAHTIKDIKYLSNDYKKDKQYFLLSFGRSKSLSSVFGGAIITSNKKTAKNLLRLITKLEYPSYKFILKCLLYKPIVFLVKKTYNFYLGKIIHKIALKLGLLVPEISQIEKSGSFDHNLNRRYPNVLAYLLLAQIKNLYKKNLSRRRNFLLYQKKFKKSTDNILEKNDYPIRFPIRVRNQQRLIKTMKSRGIFLGKWYDSPIAPKNLPLERVGYSLGSCPNAEKISKQVVNLPTDISYNKAKMIINFLKTFNDVNRR